MLTERLYSYLVVLWLTSVALGQAPGDHNVLCRTGDNHIFPTEFRILVDTFDYQNLFNPVLISPVWLAESFGGTGNWIQNLGGSCSWQMRVCESSAGQNNWLFSQYISYEDAIEVFFDVSYRFIECRPENGCTKNYVTVYGYNRNGISDTQRVITDNYEPLFGSAESSRLQQSGPFTDVETLSFTRSTNSDGLYLGLRDEGTCGNVIRIIMYYVVCPGRVFDLVTYPETAVPVVGSSDITFVAMCASNAHSITSLEVTASSSTSTCTDVAPGGAACECDEGYMLSGDGKSCGACNAGTYRTSSDNSCRSCPGNTELNVVAASECSCVAGFYRTPQEGPEIQCTEPPSEIRNLEVVSSIDTTITIRWTRPSTTGRSDFFYRVSYSDPDNIGNFISSDDNIISGLNTVTYEVTGLVPFTPYILRVTPHNEVSDQDSNPPISEISAVTMEGIPGQPINVQSLCTVVVWQAPTDPNGNINGYEVEFSPGATRDLGPADTFYLTTNTESNSDTQVRVRASTIAGPGQWTSMINVGCSSGDGNCPDVCTTSQVTCPVCPTLLPIACPTCPTVTSAPPPTCPICPTSLTCPTCSTITTAPPSTCPTCPTTTSTTSGLRFELNGITYLNNTVVELDDIGMDEAALLCITDNTGCCNTIIRKGEFFYPNGSTVANNAAGNTFYRNRGDQLIRLHRRNNAQAPSGQYGCQIPDASGVDQTIYINIISSQTSNPPCPNCPTLPPPTCSTCPTIIPPAVATCSSCPMCPTLTPPACPTCPTCSPTTPCMATCPDCPNCPTCSTATCPPPATSTCTTLTCPECPTNCPTSVSTPGLRFELNGITYLNNTVVNRDDIGIDEAALLCITDNTGCCNTIIRKGEFFYPNGSTVPNNAAGNTFYRNRGDQLIRLHKRNNAQAPSGQYSCQIPDASGIDQTIYINISDVSTSSLLPPSSVLDMIEVSNFFVGALNSPAISDSMELVFDDFSNKRRAAGTTTVEIEVVLGSLLIVVPKDKLASLTKGNSYNIQIKAATESSPFSFQYTEEIPQKMASTGNNNLVIYIVATAIVSIVLTSIVAATIMICIALYLRKKYKSGAVNDLLTKYNKNEYVPNSTEMNNKEEIK